jgi:hypothetical protein
VSDIAGEFESGFIPRNSKKRTLAQSLFDVADHYHVRKAAVNRTQSKRFAHTDASEPREASGLRSLQRRSRAHGEYPGNQRAPARSTALSAPLFSAVFAVSAPSASQLPAFMIYFIQKP